MRGWSLKEIQELKPLVGISRTCGGDPQRLLQSNKVTLVFPAHAGDDLKTLPNFYLQNLGNIS